MIPDNIRVDILERLAQAEQQHKVKVLLAVESGSRAWGFASPNSDYDARFIYVYREDDLFAQAVRGMLPQTYSCERGIHHYKSMAKTNYRGYLRAELVPLKKYFYVLRPLLSVRWLEQHGSPAPIEFRKLLSMIADQAALLKAIDALLQLKSASPELGLSPQIPEIHAFIEHELERLEAIKPARAEREDTVDELSSLFRATLDRAWSCT